jgi:tetratricopeptide (TPR) repeat protein
VIKPPDDPVVRAKVFSTREQVAKVNALGIAGQCDRAKTTGMTVLDAAKGIGYAPLAAEASYTLGRLVDNCMAPRQGIEYLEGAVVSAEASHDDEVVLGASVYLANLYADRVLDVHLSQFWIRHAEAVLVRFPNHPVLEAWVSVARSALFSAQGRDADALVEDKRALTLKEAALGRSNADTAVSLMNVAARLHTLGRDAEAIPIGEQAIEVFTRLLGVDSTSVAQALVNQSECLTSVRRFDDARAAIARALEIWRSNQASPFFMGYGLLDRGRLELAEGHTKEARSDLQQAITLMGDTDSGFAAEATFSLAQALWFTPQERPRALALARAARATLGQGIVGRRGAEMDTWLRTHLAE